MKTNTRKFAEKMARRRAARIAKGEHPKGNGCRRNGDVLAPDYIAAENFRTTGNVKFL